jgi:hypothetical protein
LIETIDLNDPKNPKEFKDAVSFCFSTVLFVYNRISTEESLRPVEAEKNFLLSCLSQTQINEITDFFLNSNQITNLNSFLVLERFFKVTEKPVDFANRL